MTPSFLDGALHLADDGIPVFPVGKKKAPVWPKGESPNGRDGLLAATTDPDELEALFAHPATTGIGMPTGARSGIAIIDVDIGIGHNHRDYARTWLELNRKTTLWGTTVVRTMSGGYHYYFRHRPGLRSSTNVWAKGVDLRADGGYVCIPPFMGYSFQRQVDPDDWPLIPELPATRPGGSRVSRDMQERPGQVPDRILEMRDLIRERVTWHEPVRDIVAHLVGSGWSDAEILRHTFTWTWPAYDPRTTFEELSVMIAGARAKWDRGKGPQTVDEAQLSRLIEVWNAIPDDVRRDFAGLIVGGENVEGS